MNILNILLKKEKKLNVAVTNRCNLRCQICGIWKRNDKQELSLEIYEKFFRKNHWNWISFTGGEPFLREDILDVMKLPIRYCSDLNSISVTTNGYLTQKIVYTISEILHEKLKELYVSVSLDGLKEFHDFQRGVEGSFDRAISTFYKLRDLNDKRLKVNFEYVISKLNQGKLMETIENLGLTPNDFIITIAQKSQFYDNEDYVDIIPDKDLLKQELKAFLRKYKTRHLYQIAQKIFLKYILDEKRIPCVGGKNSFYLDTNGIIYPCIFMIKELGNIENFHKLGSHCERICYSPCEGYFSLFLNWRESLWKMI